MMCKLTIIESFFGSTSYVKDTKELIPLPPLPGDGRMGFGLAATDDGKLIAVGGHNFNYQTMSNVTMLDTQADKLEWQNLPDMPSTIAYFKN